MTADHHLQSHLGDDGAGFLGRMGNAVLGLQKTEVIDQFLETFAVLGKVDCVRLVPRWNADGLERGGDLQRRLAAKARSRHACGRTATRADHLDDIFVRQRFSHSLSEVS